MVCLYNLVKSCKTCSVGLESLSVYSLKSFIIKYYYDGRTFNVKLKRNLYSKNLGNEENCLVD